jgi:hypothetical protein
MMDVKTAAAYLCIAPKTLYNRIARNAACPFPVKPKRYGNKPLFDKEDLDKWLDAL